MTNISQETSASGEVRPRPETIAQAAAEITRLHVSLYEAAVDLTDRYIEERLAGEEGDTWASFPGLIHAHIPILDSVMRQGDKVLLGAGYSRFWELFREYTLSKDRMLVPGGEEDQFVRVEAVTVCRNRRGYDPGEEYIAIGGRVLRAGSAYHGTTPSVAAGGQLAWSVPRDVITNTFSEMTQVDDGLLNVIDRMRAYEPVKQPAVK